MRGKQHFDFAGIVLLAKSKQGSSSCGHAKLWPVTCYKWLQMIHCCSFSIPMQSRTSSTGTSNTHATHYL